MALGIGFIVFMVGCVSVAVSIVAYAYFFVFNKKDGYADVLEERGDGQLIVLKSNVKYQFRGREKGKTDSMRIGSFKDCKPIDKTFSISWLSKKTNKMYILRDKDGFFHPMMPVWDPVEKVLKLKPEYRETIDWIVNEFDEKDKIKEQVSKLDKYLPHIALGVIFLAVFLTLFYNWEFEKGQIAKLQGASDELDRKLKVASNQYDPILMQKAAQIVAQYELERGTQNWSQYIIPQQGNEIVVSNNP